MGYHDYQDRTQRRQLIRVAILFYPHASYTIYSMEYNDTEGAKNYINFLNSVNGKMQREVLTNAILKHLSKDNTVKVLDAACGSGWLAGRLGEQYKNIQGFDGSEGLITYAKQNYPHISFDVANILESLPYQKESFNVAIVNMAAPDISNLETAFVNIFNILKKGGEYILTIPNPHYTYPVGVWKRSILDFLLFRKPRLIINKTLYKTQKNIQREFGNGTILTSNFYTVEDYITAASKAGFEYTIKKELSSEKDSKNFDLTYQLHRYPLFLLFVFTKA